MNEHKWSNWIRHTTSKQPVADGVPIHVITDNGRNSYGRAGQWNWDGCTAITQYCYDISHPDAPKELKQKDDQANLLIKDEYDQAFEPIERSTPELPDEAEAVPVEITGQESDVMLIAKAFGITDIPRYTILASLLGGESLERVNAWVMRARQVE